MSEFARSESEKSSSQPLAPPGDLPIIQYWHSPDPPESIRVGLRSFSMLNPDRPHLVFDETTAAESIATWFSSREAAAFQACAVPAMQADYFRYCAALALGGFYADADLRCVASLRSLLDGAEGAFFARPTLADPWIKLFGYSHRVGPYFDVDISPFGVCGRRHPLLELVVEVVTENIERRIADGLRGIWVVAGPGVLTSAYLLDRLGSVDAFLDYTRGTVLESTAGLFCEIAGDQSRAARALAGIAIRPRGERRAWVRPLPPREPGEQHHWQAVRGTIFR